MKATARGVLVAAVISLLKLQVQGALTHRYSFDNDVTDSVGGANGTIQGNVLVSGGVASFPGIVNTDYIELPAGLISNYTTVTFELWVNVLDNGPWEEIYAFGNQNAAGQGANMVMFCPHSGSTPSDFRMSYAQADPGFNDEKVVNGSGVLDNLGPIHVACVYDPPNNSMSLYTNGALVRTLSPVTTGAKQFSLTNVFNVHSWLGRSLYNGDSPYNGTIDEFRIYDKPLGPLQIFVDNMAGPGSVVTNIVVNSLTWSVATNMLAGARQDTKVTFNTASYGSLTFAGATEPIYSTSNSNVVSVNVLGQLLATGVGSATVSASYNGITNSAVVTVSGQVELIHRYSFTTDANDSVGTANGKLVGSATISGGALQLPGGTSSSDPGASYLDLPNDLMTNLTSITLEAWVTNVGDETWARVWDFGRSVGGEDVSDTGDRFLFLTLHANTGELRANIHINDRDGDVNLAWPNGVRPAVGAPTHVVWATDAAHRTGWLYANGALLAMNTNLVVTPADIGSSVNDWLGRSQFGADPTFNGSIDEFRIYNGALSPLQVGLDAASGPNTIVTNAGNLVSVQLTLGTNKVAYGALPVSAALLANFQNISNVNVTAVNGVTFQSSDANVFTVNNAGLISATGLGNATLTASYGGRTGTLAVAVSTLPGYTKAALVHRYSFSDAVGSKVVKDSAGTADGAVVGTGAAFDGKGQLTLPGGTASNADPATIAGYVDLPNHIINVLTNLSIETWVTWQGSGSWQRIFDFGTSATGEDVSDGNGNYLFMSPQGDVDLRFSVRDPATSSEPAPLTAPAPLSTNQEIYIAVSYDFSDNIAQLYSNAVVVATGAAPVAISTIDDVNNWLGRSQWGDPMFQGKFDEFRIWNGVLLPGEIASHFAAGPDSLESAPTLNAAVTGNNIVISWSSAGGFALQSSSKVGTGAAWIPVTTQPTTANGVASVTLPIGTGAQFFRLSQ